MPWEMEDKNIIEGALHRSRIVAKKSDTKRTAKRKESTLGINKVLQHRPLQITSSQ
jgi:hypothetical protein